jgi:hypothetical protein
MQLRHLLWLVCAYAGVQHLAFMMEASCYWWPCLQYVQYFRLANPTRDCSN